MGSCCSSPPDNTSDYVLSTNIANIAPPPVVTMPDAPTPPTLVVPSDNRASFRKLPVDQCKCGKTGEEIVIPEKKSIQIFLRKFYCKTCGAIW